MIKIYDGRNEFYQWDLNRKLIIDDATVTEVHFCNKTSDCSLVVAVKDGGIVDVPNILFQTDWTINVYLYCGECYTKEHATFKVHKRSKPDDYVYTETEVKRWETLEQRVNTTLDSVAEAEQARDVAEQERVEAEQARAEEFNTYSAEANSLIDVLDNYYVPAVNNHERRITQLEHHINNDYFVTDESAAYNKIIPAGACPYAEVGKVGGMSYKTRNLIPFPYADGMSKTTNGVTFTVQENGWIVANGTATSDAIFFIVDKGYDTTLITTDRVFFTCCQSGGSKETYYAYAITTGHYDTGDGVAHNNYEYRHMRYRICIVKGYTANNLVFKPMLSIGEALPYEPYFDGLRDTAVSELVSEGANLLSPDYVDGTKTSNGITFTDNGDGTITVNGTATAQASYILKNKFNLVNGVTYKASTNSADVSIMFRYTKADGTLQYPTYITKTEGDNVQRLQLTVTDGKTVDNVVVKPMLNRGTTAAPYKPYRADAVDTFAISAELRAFLEQYGYGKGVSGYPNYIDFERKIYRQSTDRVVLDGVTADKKVANVNTANGYYYASLDLPYAAVKSGLYNQGICSHFTMKYKVEAGYCYISSTNMKGLVMFNQNQTLTTVTAWNAWLKEQYDSGNPVTIEYAMAEPIEIDISEYLTEDNYIEVEAGGAIRAVNEHEHAAPTTITYLLKEGSI